MAEAKLEVLGLEFPIGIFREYHDDGFVRNIYRHQEMLNEIYRTNDPLLAFREHMLCIKFAGICQIMKELLGLRKHVHIYYLDLGDDSLNTELRGHEETHALQKLNRLDLLEVALREEQGISLSLDSLDKEIAACIGGLFAVDKRGFSPCELSSYPIESRHREAAQQLYFQGKLRERKEE